MRTVAEYEALTPAQIRGELAAIAAERPEFVYERNPPTGCSYETRPMLHGGKSRCIIGEWLSRQGVSDLALSEYKGFISLSVLASWLGGAHLRRATFNVLQETQNAQDNRIPWGLAVQEVK